MENEFPKELFTTSGEKLISDENQTNPFNYSVATHKDWYYFYRCNICYNWIYNDGCCYHKRWCPHYCGNTNNTPIGDGSLILITLVFIHLILKKLKRI